LQAGGGKLVAEVGGWSILQRPLGCVGKLVEEAAGHGEYMWSSLGRVGETCYWGESAINYVAAAYDLKTNWSVGAVSA